MPGNQTLPSRQRARVLETYRGRGHRNSNLWLVYSVKLDEDMLLHSDRSLVHWLTFLESDPCVYSFVPVPDVLSVQLRVGPAAAMLVDRKDEKLEVQVVADRKVDLATVDTDYGIATVRYIASAELQARARLAVRWLKAIGYVGQYRFKDLTPVSNQLTLAAMRRRHGTVADLYEDIGAVDRAALFASLVKTAITDHIELDLSSHGLCSSSRWKWTGPLMR